LESFLLVKKDSIIIKDSGSINFISNLEIIFCIFLAENYFVKALIPLKGVVKRVHFIRVKFSSLPDERDSIRLGEK